MEQDYLDSELKKAHITKGKIDGLGELMTRLDNEFSMTQLITKKEVYEVMSKYLDEIKPTIDNGK